MTEHYTTPSRGKEYFSLKMRKWRKENPERHKEICLRANRKVRDEVISHYGGKCCCCGENNILFLTIDHKNGGGTKHRIEINRSGLKFYYWLRQKNYPEGFQVLCFNCNCGRARNKGMCPHKLFRG